MKYPITVFVRLDYSFSTQLALIEWQRYIKDYHIAINLVDMYDTVVEEIGTVNYQMINVSRAMRDSIEINDVADAHSSQVEQVVNTIFNELDYPFEINPKIGRDFPYKYGSNICHINKIRLKHEYRGFGISPVVIKDLIFNHRDSVTLFTLMPLAEKRLIAYYKKMGFKKARGVPDLLFLTPGIVNSKLDKIPMEITYPFKD